MGVVSAPPTSEEEMVAPRKASREASSIASTIAATISKSYKDKQSRPAPVFRPGEAVLVYTDNRQDKLCSYWKGPYYVIGPSDNSGNFYDVGEKDKDAEELRKPQSVSVTRLHAFNMSRTNLQEEEKWKFGPGYLEVRRIVSHHYKKDANEIFFDVEWGDGEISGADIRDLRYNVGFDAYRKRHKISKKLIDRLRSLMIGIIVKNRLLRII